MTVPSYRTQQLIIRRLEALAHENEVRILLAVESGSRAWGFPSQDSDFDVRFVYARPASHYLSVFPVRDVIESPIERDPELCVPLDIQGWDLGKALALAMKTNRSLIEWLSSPVRYAADPMPIRELEAFVREAGQVGRLRSHYFSQGLKAWSGIQVDGRSYVSYKPYFYALRPALAVAWIDACHDFPPMNLQEMMMGIALPKDVADATNTLVAAKLSSREADKVERVGVIDAFLERVFSKPEVPSQQITGISDLLKEKADLLFRKLVEGT